MSVLTRDGVAPFIKSLLQMLDTPENLHLIRWGKTGESIVITNCAEFETKLLPKYFKTGKFCSFIRQLNIYGFHKVEDDKSSIDEAGRDASESQSARTFEFANDNFKKHHPEFMINIKRRKSVRRSLTLNNNNPNNYKAFPPMNEEDDDLEHGSAGGGVTPVAGNGISNSLPQQTYGNVLPSALTTPSLSPLTETKLGITGLDSSLSAASASNSSDHAILQQLLYQFTKSQVEFNELKYSNQQLQESHTQLQYAFQSLQQSHQNLLERVLKLTKAILGHSILYTQYSNNNLQSKQNTLVSDLQSQNSPNQSTPSPNSSNSSIQQNQLDLAQISQQLSQNQNANNILSQINSQQSNISQMNMNQQLNNVQQQQQQQNFNFMLPLPDQQLNQLNNVQQNQQQQQQQQQQQPQQSNQFYSSPQQNQQQPQQNIISNNIHQSPQQQPIQLSLQQHSPPQQQQQQNQQSQQNQQQQQFQIKDELLQTHEDTNKNLQDFILEQELFSSLQSNQASDLLKRSKNLDPTQMLALSQSLLSNDQFFNSTQNGNLDFNFYN